MVTKILHISDLHGHFEFFDTEPFKIDSNIVVFSGDMLPNRFGWGNSTADKCLQEDFILKNRKKLLDFLQGRPLISVQGNHDQQSFSLLEEKQIFDISTIPVPTRIQKINFWGFPYVYHCGDWNWQLGKERMKLILDSFPIKVDVLITHSPPFGILDQAQGEQCGIENLFSRINEKSIKYHLFGHIHEQGGKQVNLGGTIFSNGSFHANLITFQTK